MKIVEILMQQPEKRESAATLDVETGNAALSGSVASSVSSGHQDGERMSGLDENEIDTMKWKSLRVDRSQNLFQKRVGGALCTKNVDIMN